MLATPFLFIPLVAGLALGVVTGWRIRNQPPIVQFVLASLSSLLVYVVSLMSFSLLTSRVLGCRGWSCIELGSLFDRLGLMGVAISLVGIAGTLSILRIANYKSQNDRRYWKDAE